MENANKAQHWNDPLTRRLDNIRFTRLVGIALIILIVILAGLTGYNPSLGIVSIVVLFFTILVVSRPILIVYGLTLILPLVGGLARGAVIPLLRVGQALLVLGFILFLLSKPSIQGKSRLTAIDLAFALFVLSEAVFPLLALYYGGGHLILNQVDTLGDTPLQTLLGPIQYYLLYRIVVATVTSENQIIMIVKLSFVTSIIVSVIGILERFVSPVEKFIQAYYPTYVQGPDVSLNDLRITSTLGHFSGLAAYLVFTIILALACYTIGEKMKISSQLLAATTVFDSIALILTGTFSAWIGLAIGVVAVFILIRRLPKLFILILLGIALAALIFQTFLSTRLNAELGAGNAQGLLPQSFAFRVQLWQNLFLPAVGKYLVFGAGPAPAVLNYWSTEESQYLFLLLRGGLVYFFSYILLTGVAITMCWQQIKSKSRNASYPVALSLLVIFIVLNVMNVSGEYFTYVGGTQTLWTLLAVVVASRQFKALSVPATEQMPDNGLDVKSKTFYASLKEKNTQLKDASADSLLTRRAPNA